MKKLKETADQSSTGLDASKIRSIWQKCADKAKHGEFSCPFCREVFKGISTLGSHLKSHCT
jgi:hypothetical protein